MSNIRSDLQLYKRVPDIKTVHDSRYDPNTYISIQSKVNNDDQFEAYYFNKLISDGWVSLRQILDIFLYPKGIQIKDIQDIYIKSPKKDISVFKKPFLITNFPVYLNHPTTNILEIVYYAKDNSHKNRFMNSVKYKKALATNNWSWSVLLNY